jgi:hypothetical protein
MAHSTPQLACHRQPVVRPARSPLSSPPPPTPRLQICGLELRPDLARRALEGSVGWGGDADEEERAAAALGYVAAATDALAAYLGVPLRFPLRPRASRSAVRDPAPVHQRVFEESGEWRWRGGVGKA